MALKVSTCLEEMLTGPASAAELADKQAQGKLSMPLHLAIDAKRVFDTIANSKKAHATEEHLIIHISKVKEFLRRRIARCLWWADTRDCVSDGLTKGSVERTGILQLCEAGEWSLARKAVSFPEV